MIWIRGDGPQPALDHRLATETAGRAGWTRSRSVPHPLASGLVLPWGAGAVRSAAPGALAVSGSRDGALAVSVSVGRGEVLVLAGAGPLENARIPEVDAPSLLVRLAARGPVVFDERFLAPAAALAAAQALLAAVFLLAAVAPRLGAIRPPPAGAPAVRRATTCARSRSSTAAPGRSPRFAAEAWRTFRRVLERRTGIPARATHGDAARPLAARSGGAAAALRRGADALARGGAGTLVAVTRAAADAEAALAPGHHPGERRGPSPIR